MLISDIGSSDDTALLCHTDRSSTSGGEWYAPDGTRVDDDTVPGLRRVRGFMVVRLRKRGSTGSPPEGIYQCSMLDAALVRQTLYVGLYNSGGGNAIFSFILIDWHSPRLFFQYSLGISHCLVI